MNHLKGIEVESVRHLKDISIELSEERPHLILTGKNGSGKSSLLNAIMLFLTNGVQNKQLQNLVAYQQSITALENQLKTNPANAQTPQYTANLRHFKTAIQNIKNGVNLIFDNTNIINEFDSGKYLLCHFSATRTLKNIGANNNQNYIPKNKYSISEKASTFLLQYLRDLRYNQLDAKDENDSDTSQKITDWFNNFRELLRTIFDDKELELIYDKSSKNFQIIQKDRLPFDFTTMSDGFSAIVDIIVELIIRMEKNKGQNYDVEGLVLIDEIETHLHLELQRQVLPILTNFFPKLQFIVTTHSPFVVNSISNALVYDMETRVSITDASDLSYKGLVENYFKIETGYSLIFEKKLSKFILLVDNKDSLSDTQKEELIDLYTELNKLTPLFSSEGYLTFKEYSKLIKNAESNQSC